MDYLILKTLHILSATVLLGTGAGSAFFMFVANRRGDVDDIRAATRHVVLADWVFTTPAIIVQLATGLALMWVAGYGFDDGWIAAALALYLLAGACWVPVVWLQIRMRNMAEAAVDADAPLPDAYWRMERWWTALGAIAFPAVVLIVVLMVFKPF